MRANYISTFLCGILFYSNSQNQYPNLFDKKGKLCFSQKDAILDKVVEKVKWSKINKRKEPIEFDFIQALADFYMAGNGDLSCQILSNDPEFEENMFLIEYS